MLGAAVALRGEQDAVRGARDGTFDEVDVGLLAGLQHAELRVDGGVVGDHPRRPGPGTVQRAVPGGPAIAGGRAVDVDAGASVEVDGGRAAPAAVDGFVVVEAATAVLDRWYVELVLAQRGFSRREVPAGRGFSGGGVRRAERGDACRSRPGRQSTSERADRCLHTLSGGRNRGTGAGHVPDGGRHAAPPPRYAGAPARCRAVSGPGGGATTDLPRRVGCVGPADRGEWRRIAARSGRSSCPRRPPAAR